MVLGVLLVITAPIPPTIDVPAVPDSVALPLGTETKFTVPVPPFYDVDPADIPEAPPGTMIKTEQFAGAPSGMKVFRIMYHSRDNYGRDVPVSGLYAVPDKAPPPGGFPLVAYAHGTTGTNPHCGISLTPFERNTVSYSAWTTQMKPLVERGLALVATDYLGMGAPGTPMYLVGRVEAQGVLDSVRAVHAWADNIDRGRTIIWGHSQGGHSAGFAAQMAPNYAPELKFQGVAILAPGLLPSLPLAVNAVISNPEPTGMTRFVMLIARSWSATYPSILTMSQMATPRALAKVAIVNNTCGGLTTAQFKDSPIGAYFKRPQPDAFFTLASVNTPGNIRIGMPIVMAQGMKDTTILPALTLALNKLLCVHAGPLLFRIYPDDAHESVVDNSRDFIDSWMQDRYEGKPAPDNCPNR